MTHSRPNGWLPIDTAFAAGSVGAKRMTMDEVHAAAAEGFANAVAAYVAGRPGYPPAVDRWLSETLGLSGDSTVIDLGAGTGKSTAHLLKTGARVVAVEPVEAMRVAMQRDLPEVDVQNGTATAIPMVDGRADAVVCAQSFHWFASRAAVREIRRVLRPGGRLGLIWNVRDESVPWVAALTRIMAQYEDDAPRFHHGAWRQVFPAEGFDVLKEKTFSHEHCGAAERVIVDRVLSVSFIAALPDPVRLAVAEEIRALIQKTPELAGRSEVCFPYRTLAAWTQAT